MTVTLTPLQQLMLQGKVCPYCKKPSQYVDSAIVYKRSYGMIYYCAPCNAYVGVHHQYSDRALGRLAGPQLRDCKKQAHKYFDKLWNTGLMTRDQAYQMLSQYLQLPPQYTHIGMFNINTCKKVV